MQALSPFAVPTPCGILDQVQSDRGYASSWIDEPMNARVSIDSGLQIDTSVCVH